MKIMQFISSMAHGRQLFKFNMTEFRTKGRFDVSKYINLKYLTRMASLDTLDSWTFSYKKVVSFMGTLVPESVVFVMI